VNHIYKIRKVINIRIKIDAKQGKIKTAKTTSHRLNSFTGKGKCPKVKISQEEMSERKCPRVEEDNVINSIS